MKNWEGEQPETRVKRNGDGGYMETKSIPKQDESSSPGIP